MCNDPLMFKEEDVELVAFVELRYALPSYSDLDLSFPQPTPSLLGSSAWSGATTRAEKYCFASLSHPSPEPS